MHRSVGPYELVRELGRGGMGVVYEARHPAFPRRLALKLILREAAESKDALTRFRREAELLARLAHPHVVRVHAMAEAPEGPYLVTDFEEGRALHEVARERPMPFEDAARLVRTLCDAVAALHAAGILHRDLKPHNVIVRPDGQPVLLDFGLARDLTSRDRLTVTGALMGTPAYMAPEQAEGLSPGTLGPTVDVYALGAVLYECLAGAPPFDDAQGPMVTLKRVLVDAPRWPSTRRRGVPDALEAICRVAMAKAPGARYPTASAMRDDLDAFLRGEPPWALGRAPSDPGAGRTLALVGLAALACAGLVVALVVGLTLADPVLPPSDVPTASVERPAPPPPPPPSTPTRGRGLPHDRSVAAASISGGLALPHPAGVWVVSAAFVDDDTAFTWDTSGHVWTWAFVEDPTAPRRTGTLEGPVLAAVSDRASIFVRLPRVALRLDRELLVLGRFEFEERPLQEYENTRPLALAPDGTLVVPTERGVHLLDAGSMKARSGTPPLAFPGAVWPAVAAATASRIAVGEGRPGVTATNKVDYRQGRRQRPDDRLEGPERRGNPDDDREEVGHGAVFSWSPLTGPARRCPDDPRDAFPSSITSLAIGRGEPPPIAFGMYSGFVNVWLPDGSVRRLSDTEGDAMMMNRAHPADGHVLGVAFVGDDLLTLAGGYARSVARNDARLWSSDGRLLGARDGLLRPARGLALSPSGERLLVSTYAERDEGHAEVWSVDEVYRALGVKRAPR